jgi:GINS complex subunit 2
MWISASDDIVEPDLTRRLLRDLREVRQAKARKGIETVGDTHLQMDNLGLMEISEIRFLNKASDQLRQLNAVRTDTEGGLGMDDGTTWDE